MTMPNVESYGSRVSPAKPSQKQRRHRKVEVYQEVLRRLKDSDCPEAFSPSFEDELWAHFNRLPARYALDVNIKRAEDVLTHKRLLLQARDPENWPIYEVRMVQMPQGELFGSNSVAVEDTYIHPLPNFGSSTNLESLALRANKEHIEDEDSISNGFLHISRPMHEMTFSTADKPKLLSQMTAWLAEIGLNILEAHAFSTNDGYSLNVFVVIGWPYEVHHSMDLLHMISTRSRKVLHKNVVKFTGACTKSPSLFIVTEFMSGGSVYDYLHKKKGVFRLPSLLRVAIDVSKGMNYLHQNNIIHRDLKTANLLLDENEVVKVADFGVARVKTQSGVMTAETGTYRWMAPEVIEHKPYNHKADVFSFGIMMWELLTGKVPYEYLTPLQADVGVLQKGLRPTIPKNTHSKLASLLEQCWQKDPALRPDFTEILDTLYSIAEEARH